MAIGAPAARFFDVLDEIGRKPLRQLVAGPGHVAANSRFRFAPHRERLVEPSELRVDPYQYRRELIARTNLPYKVDMLRRSTGPRRCSG
jgi:hypothetical protein